MANRSRLKRVSCQQLEILDLRPVPTCKLKRMDGSTIAIQSTTPSELVHGHEAKDPEL